MHVVFLHGPIAAGKFTVGVELSALLGIPLFHNHLAVDTALTVFPFGSPGFRKLREAIWLTCFSEAAAEGRSFIFTFTPESTVDPTLVSRLVQSVAARGGQVLFVELRCSRDALLRRLGNASRRKFGKLADPSLYIELEAQGAFSLAQLPPPLAVIDTEKVAPSEAAAQIAETFRKHLRAA